MSLLRRLFGGEAAVAGPATWADVHSGNCDVCGETLLPDGAAGYLVPRAEFKRVVDSGFNPATAGRLGPAGKLMLESLDGDTDRWRAEWKKTIVDRSRTDWVVCTTCAGALGGRSPVADAVERVKEARSGIVLQVQLELTPRVHELRTMRAAGRLKAATSDEDDLLVEYLAWMIAKLVGAVSAVPDGPRKEAAVTAAHEAAGRRFADRHASKAKPDVLEYFGDMFRLDSVTEDLLEAATSGYREGLVRFRPG